MARREGSKMNSAAYGTRSPSSIVTIATLACSAVAVASVAWTVSDEPALCPRPEFDPAEHGCIVDGDPVCLADGRLGTIECIVELDDGRGISALATNQRARGRATAVWGHTGYRENVAFCCEFDDHRSVHVTTRRDPCGHSVSYPTASECPEAITRDDGVDIIPTSLGDDDYIYGGPDDSDCPDEDGPGDYIYGGPDDSGCPDEGAPGQ
jgi:hypothetical protein